MHGKRMILLHLGGPVAKLINDSNDRAEDIAKMEHALSQPVVHGIETSISLH